MARPSFLPALLRRPAFWVAVIVLGILIVSFLMLDLLQWRQLLISGKETLLEYPLRFFLAVVILPGLGIPSSPFFLIAGIAFAPAYGFWPTAILLTLALTLNIAWTHLLAAGPGRRWAAAFLRRTHHDLPRLSEENRLTIVCLIRLAPYIPLPVQNYFIGLGAVPLSQNLLTGGIAQFLYAILFLTFGEALYEGRIGLAGFLATAILTTALLGYFLSREFQRRGVSSKTD